MEINESPRRYSGKQLEKLILDFLKTQKFHDLKIDSIDQDFLIVYSLRCGPFDNLIDLLEDKIAISSLNSQHDMIKIFLNKA